MSGASVNGIFGTTKITKKNRIMGEIDDVVGNQI